MSYVKNRHVVVTNVQDVDEVSVFLMEELGSFLGVGGNCEELSTSQKTVI